MHLRKYYYSDIVYMLEIIFTSHAIYQIREREILKSVIIFALKSPDKIILQDNFRKRAVKIMTRGKRRYALVVIYQEKRSTKTIITVFITSKIKKYLK